MLTWSSPNSDTQATQPVGALILLNEPIHQKQVFYNLELRVTWLRFEFTHESDT